MIMNAKITWIAGPILAMTLAVGSGLVATNLGSSVTTPPAVAATPDPSEIAAPVMPTTPATDAPTGAPTPTPVPTTIVYSIDGSGTAMVTYLVGSGFSEEQHIVTLPWSATLTDDQMPRMPIVGAQHTTGGGTIACTITRSGALNPTGSAIAHAESTGPYAVVQCAPPA
jgi:hypothetical protein